MSLANKVYDGLKADLFAGRLNTCGLILEQDVAKQYEVSKTPAREALNRLADDGFLIKYPRKGYMLKKLSLQQFDALLETRYQLLASFTDLILARNSDEDLASFEARVTDYSGEELRHNGLNSYFYIELARLTKNEWVIKITEQLLASFFCCPDEIYYRHASERENTLASHYRIIDALKSREPESFRQALKDDIFG